MEHTLKCNMLKCRKELGERALVTTCSHVFCMDCANETSLIGSHAERRSTCPACNSSLTNADDAVVCVLNPSEEYRTSVLSGLSPNIIMECAGRALSFWAYQTTQEIVYQRYLEKTLSDKFRSLDMHLEKTVNEANAEIDGMRNQMKVLTTTLPAELTGECENMRRKYEELGIAYKEKSRKLLQTQELYDRVKRRVELGQIHAAACDEIETHLQSACERSSPLGASPGRGGVYENQVSSMNAQNNVPSRFPRSFGPTWQGGAQENTHFAPKLMKPSKGAPPTFGAQRFMPAATPSPLNGTNRPQDIDRSAQPQNGPNLGAGLASVKIGHPNLSFSGGGRR